MGVIREVNVKTSGGYDNHKLGSTDDQVLVSNVFSTTTNSAKIPLTTFLNNLKNQQLKNFITSTNTTGAPVFSSATKGVVPTCGTSNTRGYYLAGNGTWAGAFMPATTFQGQHGIESQQGQRGLVPTPPASTTEYTVNMNYSKFWLNASGHWATIPTYTTAYNGLVPAPDASKSTTAFYLNGTGDWTKPVDTTYDIFSNTSAGLVPSPTASKGTTGYVLTGNHAWTSAKLSDTTYTNFTSATMAGTSITAGAAGLVPGPSSISTYQTHPGTSTVNYGKHWLNSAGGWRIIPQFSNTDSGLTPASGSSNTTAFYLNGAGTWTKPQGTTYAIYNQNSTGGLVSKDFATTTISSTNSYLLSRSGKWLNLPSKCLNNATASSDGLMSSSDKTKLNNLGKLTKLTTTTTTSTNTTTISYTLTSADATKYSWLIIWLGGTNKNYNLIMLPAYRGSGAFDGSDWNYKRGTTTYLSITGYTINTVNSSDSMSVYGME